MLDLAVIIVTWNVRELALDGLRTLGADLARSGLESAIRVVDNGSADGTAGAIEAAFPAVEVTRSEINLGFAGGNNLALRALGFRDQPTPNSDGPRAVFLLNPDTLVQPGAVQSLWDALFSLPKAGLVGARLSYADGAFQHSAFRFPGLAQIAIDLFPLPARLHGRLYESGLNGRYRRALYAGGGPFPVDHPLGATMLLRREAIEQTGLFDEQFFMYCEEIDWCMRIRRAGWEIYAVPAAHVIHLEGRSTGQIRPASLVNLWTSRLKLFRKHYSGPRLAAARMLVRLGMAAQIRAARRAEAEQKISAEQAAALIEAYRHIIALYRGSD